MKFLEQYLKDPNVLNIYLHGSRVYGTNSEQSDFDYIIVIEDYAYKNENIKGKNYDLNFYKKTDWIRMCEDNNIDFCECYYLPPEMKIKEKFIPDFKINKEKLRSNFSKTASNSFVKCKKKLEVKKDFSPYIGKKSLWHSFRILMFGIQILEKGKIYDYSCANYLYDKIVKNPINNWDYYKQEYQQLYNHYKSEFRKFD